MAKKGLGRGFESLIPSDLFDESFDPTADDDHRLSDLRQLKLSDIVPDPEQPRKRFEESALEELTASIKRHGVLQPIVVTPKGKQYEIIAGERRFRASQQAGLETVPALVRTTTAQQRLELALIENLQRRDLNPLEIATAYAKLRDQFNLTLEEVGVSVGGKSVSAISNTLRLLRLPKEVQQVVAEGMLSEGQVRPLIDLDEEIILELYPRIIKERWSSRKVEEVVRSLKQAAKQSSDTMDSTVESRYETDTELLKTRFKTLVRVQSLRSGKGKIVIDFASEEEFERLKQALLNS